MSVYTLLLRLAAPMQSWGTESKFDTRRTGREPSKSGVVGLLAAAMGIRRDEDEKIAEIASLRLGVRVDKEGVLEKDFQMVRVPKQGDFLMAEETKTSYVTNRYYLSDACFTVGLEGSDRDLLCQIEEALSHPAFPLYLGRRSCPPVGKICLGIRDLSLEDALKCEPILLNSSKNLSNVGNVRFVFETKPGEAGALLRDQPISFNPENRRYTFRQLKEEFVTFESLSRLGTGHSDNPVTLIMEHDPIAELE